PRQLRGAALRIRADHVLRGYEAVATRLAQTIAAAAIDGPSSASPPARALVTRLARDAGPLPARDAPPPRPPGPGGRAGGGPRSRCRSSTASAVAVTRGSRTASGSASSQSAFGGR